MDGNRTHQVPREWHLNGFEGRWDGSLNPISETTCENAENSRTKINTKPDRAATPETPDSATLEAPRSATQDPDLAVIVTAWPELPEAIRAGMVAMVRASDARRER